MSADKHENLFKQWLSEHKGLMFKVIRAYAPTPQDQDDLFQEILLQLWSSIPSFQGNAKQTTWIYRVALNTALVWQRKEKRKRKRRQRTMIDFNQISEAQHNDSLTDSKIMDQVYQAIRELGKIDGSIVFMYLDGLSYDQMAEVLGISKNNVGVKLNRAKKQLAQLLKGLIDDV